MGRIVRVTDPEEAVRLFEAGMLYWNCLPSTTLPLGPAWAPHNVRVEVKSYPSSHRLVYIVEDDEERNSMPTDSEE